ncbi:MAG: hypothetical protein AMXMBFR64_54310 [Myxococcales bacterium]
MVRVVVMVIMVAVQGCKAAGSEQPDGQALFGSACARCHAADGTGGIAEPGRTPPRDLSAGSWQTSVTDEHIRRVILEGTGGMPPFKDVLQSPQVTAVVQHVRTLRRTSAQPVGE